MDKIKKNSSINLKWAKDDKSSFFNFGDDLNPYLINKLTGCEVDYIRFANSRFKIIKSFITNALKFKLSIADIKDYYKAFVIKYYIISIGSILQWYSSGRCIVWGAGIISKDARINQSTFLAVRGNYTRRRLSELGFTPPDAVGDPALLLPLVYKPKINKKYKFGIIPHIVHFDKLNSMNLPDDILLINLNSNDVESVVNDIVSCEKTISTSLHGIIVSHAYNIKSLWYKIDGEDLYGDNVKFYDYFSSVGISEYSPFILRKEDLNSINLTDVFNKTETINSIQIDLKNLQNKLISVAPFEVTLSINLQE